jgi:hypothetical protein
MRFLLASVSYPEFVDLEALAAKEFNKNISGREQRQGVKVVPTFQGLTLSLSSE